MATIIPAKIQVFDEETQTGAAISEAVGDKFGANINHFIRYEEIRLQWVLNGQYDLIGVPEFSVDGFRAITKNCRIAYCSMYNINAGSSGSLLFDLVRYPADGSPGVSLFSVKPVIPFSVGLGRIVKDVIDNTDIAITIGCTSPVFAVTELQAGDMLALNVGSKQVGGKNAGIELIIQTL